MIKKLFFWLLNQTGSQQAATAQLGDDYKFLTTLKLANLHNIFDGEAIWLPDFNKETPEGTINNTMYSGGLYEALKSTPIITAGYDDRRDRAIGENRHFTDILIFINADKWQFDAVTGGSQIYILANRLQALHLDHFKNTLLNERQPRYCVMPARDDMPLANDEVIIQFGLSVFIPDENDRQIANTVFSHFNHIGYHLSPWVFFDKNGAKTERPATLYEGQKCLRFAKPQTLQSCFSVPKWFEQPYEEAIIMISFQQDGYDKGKLHLANTTGIKHAPPTVKNKSGWSYPFFGGKQRIGIDFYPIDYQSRHDIKDVNGNIIGKTYVGINHTKVETSPDPLIFLSHLALPVSSMLLPNFDQWHLAFNQNGKLIDTLTSSEVPFLRFFTKDGNIYFQGEGEAERLNHISSVNIGKHIFEVLPSPSFTALPQEKVQSTSSTYHNLISLPVEWRKVKLSFPESRSLTLGRSIQACHQDLLAQTGTLSYEGKIAEQQSLHDIYFSREHAELSYEEKFISLRQLSESTPIIILDRDKKQIDTLNPSENRTVMLESGQAIILGCYVFQVYLPENKQ